jgi:hypothetical protein
MSANEDVSKFDCDNSKSSTKKEQKRPFNSNGAEADLLPRKKLDSKAEAESPSERIKELEKTVDALYKFILDQGLLFSKANHHSS